MNSSQATLREKQVQATRDLILRVAMSMMRDRSDQPFSHEAIAEGAGVGARTVYRHFPSRADLLQAMWHRLREETETRFPQDEAEIVPLTRTQFGNFDEHAALVRASISLAGNEVRERGGVEGRAAFRKSLVKILTGLSPAEQRRLIAVCVAIYSAPFWQLLRDRGQLSEREAQQAGAWAIEAVINAAKSEARAAQNKQRGNKEGKP